MFGIERAQAQAQVPDAGRLLDTLKPPPAPAQSPAEIGIKPEAPRRLEAEDGVAVFVKRFRVTGVTVFSADELETYLKPWVERQLTFAQLNEVAAAVTAYYRKNGYLTAYAYLPAQEIKDGVIEIAVLEGRLGAVRWKGEGKLRVLPSVVDGYLATLKRGEPIHERDLERVLSLLNDIPGVHVRSTLEPGGEVGTADLVVEVDEEKMLSAAVDLENYGSRSTGEFRAGTTIRIRDPFGHGETVTLRGVASHTGGLDLGQVSYMRPVGYHGLRVGLDYSRLIYRLGKNFAALDGNGDAEQFSLRADYPVVRSRRGNVYLRAAFDHKTLNDRLDAVGFASEKRVRALRLGVSADRVDALGAGGLSTIAVSGTLGELDLRSDAVAVPDASPAGHHTQGGFKKVEFDAGSVRNLAGAFSLAASLRGQVAATNLDSSEKFELGGPYGVRAYPVNEATADSGAIATAELRYSLGTWGGAVPTLFGFVDRGWARLNHNPLATDTANTRSLWGYGVGASLARLRDYFQLRVMVAWRGNHEQPLADVDRVPRVWLQMVKEL